MSKSSRTFRIFVSSTFSDLKAERNALQENVFPRLRELAEAHGCHFQAIDLRWGVSEEAALDQQTMKICLGEIKRCQQTSPRPNFVVLLGDRYGWQPLPYEIDALEFESILPLTTEEDQNQLNQWYRRDDNAVPAVYVLQPRNGNFEQFEDWEKVEKRLRSVFQAVVGKLSLSNDAMLKYSASATEQEIVAGAMKVTDAQEHVFGFFRNISDAPIGKVASAFFEVDPQSAQKQSDLKRSLRQALPGNIYEYNSYWQDDCPSIDHLEQLCEDVFTKLSAVILAEVNRLDTIVPLDLEIASHELFGVERARVFVGREDILGPIKQYISSTDSSPLVIWGESGSGKSSIIAKSIEQAQIPNHNVVFRFIGTTPESSSTRSLITGLCKQIARCYGKMEINLPTEFKELEQEFLKQLSLANKQKPLVLFLDALDQLSDFDNTQNLSWIPAELPPNVHLVISTLPGINLEILERITCEQNRFEVRPMSVSDGSLIIDNWLTEIHQTLHESQKAYILNKFSHCGLPLYLKLAFEEAKLWKSYTPLPLMEDSISGMIESLFQRLSLESNHGKMIVSHSLGYLAASKNGLSEDELLNVLSQDTEVLTDFQRRSPKSPKVNQLPVVIWSRLYFDLESYLTERCVDGTNLLGFYHRQMSDVCLAIYKNESRHEGLAKYFHNLPLYLGQNKTLINLRKIAELPYQLVYAGESQERYLIATLSDLNFIDAKCTGKDVYELLADFDRLESNNVRNLLLPVRKSIAESIEAIINRPNLVIQTIYNCLSWQRDLSHEIMLSLESTKSDLDQQDYWIRSLAPLPDHQSANDWRVNYDQQSPIQSISFDLQYIAVSNLFGEVTVYDLSSGKLVNRLKLDCSRVKSIAFCDKPWRFAWIDSENNIHSSLTTSTFKVLNGETKILYHPNKGIIFLNQNLELVCWLPERERVTVIAQCFPAPISILKFTADEKCFIYAAGSNSVHLGIIKWDDNQWLETKIEYSGVPIVDLDCDPESQKFAVLQKNRCLSMLDFHGTLIAQSFYEADSQGRIIGTPVLCTINQIEKTDIFFVNNKGQLSHWNWQNGQLEPYFNCCPSQNIQSVRVLQTAQKSEKVYFSTDLMAGVISQSADHEETACHQSEVSACVITPKDHIVSIGKNDNRLKWFSPYELKLLNEKTTKDISVINIMEEGDQVLLGDRNGCVWRQYPERDTVDSEVMHVFNNAIKEVASAGCNKVFVAEEHGQVLIFDFLEWQKHKLIRPLQGAGRLIRIIPAKDNEGCWVLSVVVEGANGINHEFSHLELIQGGRSEVILHSPELFRDFIVGADGMSIGLIGNSLCFLRKSNHNWQKITGEHPINIQYAKFLDESSQLIAINCTDNPWLEIWKSEEKIQKVAEAYLPEMATCLAAKGNLIVVGCQSGQIISYHLEHRR